MCSYETLVDIDKLMHVLAIPLIRDGLGITELVEMLEVKSDGRYCPQWTAFNDNMCGIHVDSPCVLVGQLVTCASVGKRHAVWSVTP